MRIQAAIRAYHGNMTGEHHRYRSWEYCYRYFRSATYQDIVADIDPAALQLGFYLASWGMYRGSGFLLQPTYTVHRGVIDELCAPRFSVLWARDFGANDSDTELIPLIRDAVAAVPEAYRPFAPAAESRQASDALVTKVILWTLGCLPACDRYFIDGFKSVGFSYSYLNRRFIERALRFCRENVGDLRKEQARIERTSGFHYPLMKLVDMHFWQIGYGRGPVKANASGTTSSALA